MNRLLTIIAMIFLGFSSALSAQTETEIKTYTIDSVFENADELVGTPIVVEGICNHVCSHGARKIFIKGDGDKTLRAQADEQLGAFDKECLKKEVVVSGILKEQRIDEEYLAEWENKLKESQAENEKSHCSAGQKAQGEKIAKTTSERINNFRERIAERTKTEGKNYVSVYHLLADGYTIK